MFRRKIYSKMLNWKQESAGSTALLIEGARRIGKSTVAEAFAQQNYKDYLLIDFSLEGQEIKDLFTNGMGNLDAFFRNLFLLKQKTLPEHEAVIIFDEVQLCPEARQAIKPLVADGRYQYIETGSLISIKDNTEKILIPSEEYRVKMFPMDFDEFLWACGNQVTSDAIKDAFNTLTPLPDAVHRKTMNTFREYLAVGGMPQAVAAFVDGRNYTQIDFVKQSILQLYSEDLHKYDKRGYGKVSAVFNSIPSQLSHHNAGFKFATVERGARFNALEQSIDFLKESMTVNVCQNVSYPDMLLDLAATPNVFKMFMADTGLLVTQSAQLNQEENSQDLYKQLVLGKLGSNIGAIVENVVAQEFVANGHTLYYHEFKHNASSRGSAKGASGERLQNATGRTKLYEIDFLLKRGKRLCPVEVKSSGYKAHKSLDLFVQKYQAKINQAYVLHTKNLHRENNVVYLPLYMASCL